jgi:hypothetical protein
MDAEFQAADDVLRGALRRHQGIPGFGVETLQTLLFAHNLTPLVAMAFSWPKYSNRSAAAARSLGVRALAKWVRIAELPVQTAAMNLEAALRRMSATAR